MLVYQRVLQVDDVWCTVSMKHDRTSNHHWDPPLREPVRTWMLPRMPLMLAGTPVYPSAAWCEATQLWGARGISGLCWRIWRRWHGFELDPLTDSAPPPNDPQEEQHVPLFHPKCVGFTILVLQGWACTDAHNRPTARKQWRSVGPLMGVEL